MSSAAGPAQAPSTPQRASGAVGQAALPVAHLGLLSVGVMAAMVMQVLDTTIANVALPHMQASLNATSDTVTWVLTSYIVAAAIATPITGWLSDRFGSRNLFLVAVSGFIIASMLCGIATSLEEMVAFRLLQGICGAFIPPLSQTVMRSEEPTSELQSLMRYSYAVFCLKKKNLKKRTIDSKCITSSRHTKHNIHNCKMSYPTRHSKCHTKLTDQSWYYLTPKNRNVSTLY